MPMKSIPAFGLGCVDLTDANSSIIDSAIELGVTLFDTADCYGNHQSETVLGEKLKKYNRDELFISSKVGVQFSAQGVQVHGDNAYIKNACLESLKRLQLDYLDLLYLHRTDPNIPIEISIQALCELYEEGKIHSIGLSEVNADQIKRAHAIHPVSAVQIEYAPWSRQDENNHVIETCKELGIQVVAYSPLGRGFFTSNDQSFFQGLPNNDFRQILPRYHGAALASNLLERQKLSVIAERNHCTLAQLILAWELEKGFTCIPGTTQLTHLKENRAALDIKLTSNEVNEIDSILQKSEYQGLRYPSEAVSAIFPEKNIHSKPTLSPMTLFHQKHRHPETEQPDPSRFTIRRLIHK